VTAPSVIKVLITRSPFRLWAVLVPRPSVPLVTTLNRTPRSFGAPAPAPESARVRKGFLEKVRRPNLPDGWAGMRGVRLIAIAAVLVVAAQWVHDWTPVFVKLGEPNILVGVDYSFYMDVTRRFLGGGPFYEAYQLAGPYGTNGWPVLYPPQAIVLFAPFTVLPAIVWWIIPISIVVAVVAWHRPGPFMWPLLALCLWWPATTIKILTGNPVLWATAGVALGTLYRWPAVLALIKPSLFPIALIGARDRRWWLLAALGALPFAWMIPDYLRVLSNFQAGIGYSIQEVPVVLVPVLAWLGTTRTQAPPKLSLAGSLRRMSLAFSSLGGLGGR
jgi:hypothetical protein